MNTFYVVTTGLSSAAAVVATAGVIIAHRASRTARRQSDIARQAVDSAREAGHGVTAIHFSHRFIDLMRGGERFNDRDWTYQFWSLHASEFYFFENGWLPEFMYELWMVDLVSSYRHRREAWPSHQQYLERYAVAYPGMARFFRVLGELATKEFESEQHRHLAINAHLTGWPRRAGGLPSGGPAARRTDADTDHER